MRAGFGMVLEAADDIAVVGEAANGEQAVHGARRLKPDVVLMDIRVPELEGIAATRQIARGAPTRRLESSPHDVRPRRVRLRRPRRGRERVPAQGQPARAARRRDPRRGGRGGAARAVGHEPAHRSVRARSGGRAGAGGGFRRAHGARGRGLRAARPRAVERRDRGAARRRRDRPSRPVSLACRRSSACATACRPSCSLRIGSRDAGEA